MSPTRRTTAAASQLGLPPRPGASTKTRATRTRTATADVRELHEVLRDEEGRITGVLRPPAPDLAELSEKVLETMRAAGRDEGFREGAQVGADAAARAFAQAGAEAGFVEGYRQGVNSGFQVGREWQARYPDGHGPAPKFHLHTYPADSGGDEAA